MLDGVVILDGRAGDWGDCRNSGDGDWTEGAWEVGAGDFGGLTIVEGRAGARSVLGIDGGGAVRGACAGVSEGFGGLTIVEGRAGARSVLGIDGGGAVRGACAEVSEGLGGLTIAEGRAGARSARDMVGAATGWDGAPAGTTGDGTDSDFRAGWEAVLRAVRWTGALWWTGPEAAGAMGTAGALGCSVR